MHHQFKELAGVNVNKEPMEVGPTAHYVMGGVMSMLNPKRPRSRIVRLQRVASGLHGAN